MPILGMRDLVSTQMHDLSAITYTPPRNPHLADHQYEVVMEAIKDFESDLDEEHEVSVKLASFGQSVTMAVTEIGYHNPDVLIFYGYVNDSRSQLVQHVSQLSFLLMSVQKVDPTAPPRRIGFAPLDED